MDEGGGRRNVGVNEPYNNGNESNGDNEKWLIEFD